MLTQSLADAIRAADPETRGLPSGEPKGPTRLFPRPLTAAARRFRETRRAANRADHAARFPRCTLGCERY